MKITKETNGNGRKTTTIGPTTPVQIGLIMGVIGAIIGITWQASRMYATINTKLDVLISDVAKATTSTHELEKKMADFEIWRAEINRCTIRAQEMEKKVADLELWRAEINRNGTIAVDLLRKEFQSLQKEFDRHTYTIPKP